LLSTSTERSEFDLQNTGTLYPGSDRAMSPGVIVAGITGCRQASTRQSQIEDHSVRSARMGSMDAARRAGTYPASKAQAASSSEETARISGS
jgi:hypothetical protein